MRRVSIAVVVVLFLGTVLPAEAQSRRYRKRSSIRTALAPLFLARSIVHAVAEPIVHHAPRAVIATATLPIRAARALPHHRSDRYEEDDYADEAGEEVYQARSAGAEYPQAVRVAYMAPRPRQPSAPPREFSDYTDDEAESAPPQISSRGSRPVVEGSRAVLRNGIAYAPSRAPEAVKRAIWAGNDLRGKPYVWGGGHRSFHDRGYDCSGTVSYALHAAGALSSPLPSSQFTRYGQRGRGRWITVYARNGHTFAVIAGLRLDTTDFLRGGNTGPRWHADMRDTRGYAARHPAGM
jgi:cell wall-associated NlpC family hydrolase